MKKIIYTSIILTTLFVNSCRNQDDMVQVTNVQPTNVSKTSLTNSIAYATFGSSVSAQGDPVKPPQD